LNKFIVVFITCAKRTEAKKIADALVSSRLAACVNIIPSVESIFRWEGKIDNAKEVLLVVKTRQGLFSKLVKKVKSMHSYEVPEIIALPIVCGEPSYLKWINRSLQ
jgi:periplasmic divalent cation tolerance protein